MFQTDNHKHYVIGLGLTSMINHDDLPNAEFFVTVDSITVKALRGIPIGTEVTVDYGWGVEEWALVGITYVPPKKISEFY
jgi:SET domain-containing protein